MSQVTLQDKYTLRQGRVFLTGLQAVVRLALMQRWRDQENGLNTAGFISGYRGSPIAGLDVEAWRAEKLLKEENIHFSPGVNEDLGATAVWGAQQANLWAGARYDGVFGMWYGKGPGVDRSMDAIKHANAAGTSPRGGVLALCGDDHSCKSSTMPHQSDQALISAFVPVLSPSNVQDVLDLGLYGWALSRFSGLWVGFKLISDTVETAASIYGDPGRVVVKLPENADDYGPHTSIRWPDAPLDQERRLHDFKIPAALAFARANPLNKTIIRPAKGAMKLGIVATGKSYIDALQALSQLGLNLEGAKAQGIGVYKVGLVWPLEKEGLCAFAKGAQELLVLEEKQSLVETQIKEALYHLNADERPRITGKTDEKGKPLLPETYELSALQIAQAISKRMEVCKISLSVGQKKELSALQKRFDASSGSVPLVHRSPFYCSGCPHNTSAKAPEGSRALAGIGCHYMATWIDGEHTQTFTHMGGEGVPWIGQQPFREEKHIFANLGDGTYYHSGLLAIRACVASGVNITYKILYNDAVAMTGGQPVDGPLDVAMITRQVHAEGVEKIVVVSDEPTKYPVGMDFAPGVRFYDRSSLDEVQDSLKCWKGTSVLIYDQTCAAEKRRRRKRGLMEDPPRRIFINDAVCEGCGDCSRSSNCLSVMPLETEFGTKRAIDQSSCNKDFTCADGFCPSFVTVEGAKLKKQAPARITQDRMPPEPKIPSLNEPYGIYIAGVGGTGIVTVGALMGMAAHIEGKGCAIVDQIGLAQKGGAVVCQVKLGPSPESIQASRIGTAEAKVLLGCDLVVSAYPDSLSRVSREKSKAIINTNQNITGDFVKKKGLGYDFHHQELIEQIQGAVGKESATFLDGTGLATALIGDSIATNIFMLGAAYQKGLIPLKATSIEEVIRLNNVAVEDNLRAFTWGRLSISSPEILAEITKKATSEKVLPKTLKEVVAHRMEHLEKYQNSAYAKRYENLVARCAQVESKVHAGKQDLSLRVAKNYAKLLAYKDEYEVARLFSDPSFRKSLDQNFEKGYRLNFHLAPPSIARKDRRTGLPIKNLYGPWMMWAFQGLAKLKGLRGTALDIFGYQGERKLERRLIRNYEQDVETILKGLSKDNYDQALKRLSWPDQVRGFGHVKEASLKKAFEGRKK